MACEYLSTPIVLFRDSQNRAHALLDRCAHRNVPLSSGRVVGDEVMCRYHGWRYNGRGQCVHVPALTKPLNAKAQCVNGYPTCEQQGFVWVYSEPDTSPVSEPFTFAHMDDSSYHAVRYGCTFDATLHAVLENILDVPHTAFLHRGLFRSGGKQPQDVVAHVTRSRTGVQAQYEGEAVPAGVLGKLLAPGGGTISHIDRFELPSIAQVDYALGASRVLITNVLTPVSQTKTAMYTVVVARLPLAGGAIARALTPLGRYVAHQDAEVLREQLMTIERFGSERFVSTEVDVLGGHILRLLRQAERGDVLPDDWSPPQEPSVTLRL